LSTFNQTQFDQTQFDQSILSNTILSDTILSNIIRGKLIINEFGNGFVNLPNMTIYIPKSDLNFAFDGEDVEVEIISSNNSKYSGKVINFNIIGRKFVGQVHHIFHNEVFIYIDQLGKSNLISIQTDQRLSKNDYVRVEITSIKNNKLNGTLINKLSSNIDDIINFMYGLDDKYKELSVDIDNSIDNNQSNLAKFNRTDLTSHNVFTIDPPNCLDCDDAFSICKSETDNFIYHIYVHIADITDYINPSIGSSFDKIIKRANTIYGLNRNWPVLSRELSENICSILPNKKTNVITSEFIFNQKLNKVDYVGFFYSQIISKNKYNYDYVDQNIETNGEFQILLQSSKIIDQNYLEFPINSESETDSHLMVKNWMLHLNQIMGNHIGKLFRIHPQPNKNQLQILSNLLAKHEMNLNLTDRTELINNIIQIKKSSDPDTNNLIDWTIKTTQSKASYSEINSLHYGLGISSYTHFTSPIRRMSDLLIHLLLKGYNLDIGSYIKFLNEGDLLQNKVEAFIRKHNSNIKLNQILDGIIINLSQTGIQIFVPKLTDSFNIHISKLDTSKLIFSDGLISNSNIRYQLFDKIKLKLIKYDFFTPEFDLVR